MSFNVIPRNYWLLAGTVWIVLAYMKTIRENEQYALTGKSDEFTIFLGIPYTIGILLQGFRLDQMLIFTQGVLVFLFCVITLELMETRNRVELDNRTRHRGYRRKKSAIQKEQFGETKFLEREEYR